MKNKIIKLIFITILILTCLFQNYILADNIVDEKKDSTQIKDIFEEIDAPNLLLAENNTGKIIYERNADEKIYPASLTKLLTAILVVENCELDETVTVSENAVFSVPSGYVNANLQVGEELTVEDLLYVMLIPSANDAANALAEHVGGSIQSFSTMMNTKAKELGCIGSNFTNPSGLHQKEHYTTTRDLYLIAKEAIGKSVIKKIINTKTYSLPETNKYSGETRIFTTTNYMVRESLKKYYSDYCIGGKTGYTDEAKNCVIEYAEKDGIELISIVMGENASIKGKKFLDAKIMFEYVFENYKVENIAKNNEKYETIKINNGTKQTKNLDVLYKQEINILKEKDNNKTIQKSVEYADISAPIKKGDIVGKITYEYDGIKYSTELIANSNVEESKVLINLIKLFIAAFIIYILYNFKKSNKNYKKHGKNLKRKMKKTKNKNSR